MNALRSLLSYRSLSILRQIGQNPLTISRPVDAAQSTSSDSTLQPKPANKNKYESTVPLLIPKGTFESNFFNDKHFGPAPGSTSPNTVKKYRSIERRIELVYRCNICNARNNKLVTEAAYKRGIVILQCDACAVNHLIIDNLGWFTNHKEKSFREVLAANSTKVMVIKVNEEGHLV